MLAVIPARGGSRGILNKNLSKINGKSFIYYAIQAAKAVDDITEIIVSSDDEMIKREAYACGVKTDYQRPVELSLDDTSMYDTLEHVIEWAGARNQKLPKNLMLLQPTSPLRSGNDIKEAINIYKEAKAKSLASVNLMSEHPYECVEIEKHDWFFLKKPEQKKNRRQDYSNNFYFINGAIYIVEIEWFIKSRTLTLEGETVFSIMPRSRSIDVDCKLDLEVARAFFKHNNNEKDNSIDH